jgi:hypothetical protein
MASEMIHFPNVSYVNGNVQVNITFDRFSRQFTEAQQWLGGTVLEDCKPYMPMRTGSMQQRSHVENNGRRVVFPGPYARYQYGGKVMVDSVTGKGPRKIPTGPNGGYILRFKKGAKLVPTQRDLNYTTLFHPDATDHWFDAAKAAHGEYWIAEVKRRGGGG